MNRNTSLVQASTFGPPSEPVNIGEFLESAKNWITPASADATLFAPDKTAIAGWDKYAQLSDEERAAIEVDCRCARTHDHPFLPRLTRRSAASTP